MIFSSKFYDFAYNLRKLNDLANYIHRNYDYRDLFNNKIDIDYFDLKKEGISFISKSKIESNVDPFESRFRQTMKVGSFLNKIFKNPNPIYVESFVNYYKSIIGEEFNFEFEIVKGEQIKHWYKECKYIPGSGPLNNSCMRYDESQSYLDIYSKNPKNISMLILRDTKLDMIAGRAILWKTDCGRILCDRIYVNEQHLESLFIKHINEMGYAYKYKQSYSDIKFYLEDKEPVRKRFEVTLENFEFESYPYMDTMKFLDFDTGILSNYHFLDKPTELLISDSGYTRKSSELIIDDIEDCWINYESSVSLEYLGGKITSRTSCRYSSTYNCYILKKDCYYSDKYEDYIFIDDKYSNSSLLEERFKLIKSQNNIMKTNFINKLNITPSQNNNIYTGLYNEFISSLESNTTSY